MIGKLINTALEGVSSLKIAAYASTIAFAIGAASGAYVTHKLWLAADLARQQREWKAATDFANAANDAQIALGDEYARTEANNRDAEPSIDAAIAAIPSGGPVCVRAGILRELEKLR